MVETIRNNDGTVGTVMRINQNYMNTQQYQQYAYYQLKNSTYKSDADTMYSFSSICKNLPVNFNSKIQNYLFSPPSDNLWNVEIKLSTLKDDGTQRPNYFGTSLNALYNNIIKVNEQWSNTRNEGWQVVVPHSNNQRMGVQYSPSAYMSELDDAELGVFLAQTVSFSKISIQVDVNPFSDIQAHGGFFKSAKVVKGRSDTDQLKIGFLVSNWDITEILIEPWMAAIAQRGLVEYDDNLTLKAQIIVTEYASSHPKFTDTLIYEPLMEARKKYVFDNCFPSSVPDNDRKYGSDGGEYKTKVVSFYFDSCRTIYNF